ncbi:hypothetical protein R3I93_019361 [Phoxinus phoxinus]|uniref:Uncharacterized protein n=1 Tax=Phoxinus phoxinus TaxID=58324 RepID=A0AAN9CD84_9TELE
MGSNLSLTALLETLRIIVTYKFLHIKRSVAHR